ncbi:unnamed protein product [Allacma fusca]|uniref:Abnormal spindle-like microcephaly-associated protein ASH domain-containing protein n=1 Tax=Allacma fusca TaxID=39272 RepID=A0A8J2LAD9_9HEXA|nr:unnamed protein product [Allacma fusca]
MVEQDEIREIRARSGDVEGREILDWRKREDRKGDGNKGGAADVGEHINVGTCTTSSANVGGSYADYALSKQTDRRICFRSSSQSWFRSIPNCLDFSVSKLVLRDCGYCLDFVTRIEYFIMTSYQVSPPKREPKKSGKEEPGPAVFLTLGAFCVTPKLHFEAVILGQCRRRTLIIRNPTDSACFLKFVKRPSDCFSLVESIDDQDLFIPATDEIRVVVEWRPKEEGQFFETYQVQPSNGGSKFSIHLLGKCLPPPKKAGVKKRVNPSSALHTSTAPARPNDLGLKVLGRPSTVKSSTKVTVPHSPKFSNRFSSRQGTGDNKLSNSSSVDPSLPSPSPLEKLGSLSLPFTPEPNRSKMTEAKTNLPTEELTEEKPDLHKIDRTFILCNDLQVSSLSPSSRRETYLIAAPTIDHKNPQTTAMNIIDKSEENGHLDVPNLEHFTSTDVATPVQDTSVAIELDAKVVESITDTLDSELDLVHRSVDTILYQVEEMGAKQHQAAVAAFSKLTELDEEAIFGGPVDFEDDDLYLESKTISGEFLCIDQSDLVPNFPAEEPQTENELVASIKRLLKEGHSDDDIINRFTESQTMVGEIRNLYEELAAKYKSCRECYEITKAAHLSEAFTFNRIVIQKAIKNHEIRVKEGTDICCFKSKTHIISSLLSAYNRPWLWSALCLIFHSDKLLADDIDMMNFIDENLFWNSELMDFENDGGATPKEFLDSLVPKFLQNFLEIIYLLDATGIPYVFVPNNSTKKFLGQFEAEYLECTELLVVLNSIPVKINKLLDPIHYIVQDNLRGPNLLAWTNIVRIVQELVGNDPKRPELMFNSSSIESARNSLRASLEEANKIGVPCQVLPEEIDWFFYGCSSMLDEKLLWQLVLRLRISQTKKMQGSEE